MAKFVDVVCITCWLPPGDCVPSFWKGISLLCHENTTKNSRNLFTFQKKMYCIKKKLILVTNRIGCVIMLNTAEQYSNTWITNYHRLCTRFFTTLNRTNLCYIYSKIWNWKSSLYEVQRYIWINSKKQPSHSLLRKPLSSEKSENSKYINPRRSNLMFLETTSI